MTLAGGGGEFSGTVVNCRLGFTHAMTTSVARRSKDTKLFAVRGELATSLESFEGVEFHRCME